MTKKFLGSNRHICFPPAKDIQASGETSSPNRAKIDLFCVNSIRLSWDRKPVRIRQVFLDLSRSGSATIAIDFICMFFCRARVHWPLLTSPIFYFWEIDRHWSVLLSLVRVSAREEEQQGRPQPLHPGSQISVSSYFFRYSLIRTQESAEVKVAFRRKIRNLKGNQLDIGSRVFTQSEPRGLGLGN